MKTALLLLAILFLATPPDATPPDEGQWLPIQIRNMDWSKLQARGMKMTKDEFWHPTAGGVLSAAVHLGGCTASFVSDQGLVVTNHHCGFGAIQRLSSVEKNYVREGFVAGSRADELPTGLTVAVLRRIEDITAKVHAEQALAKSPVDRARRTRAIKEHLRREGEKEPNTRCTVASFFEGREYHIYYRTVLTDVRLVYAPPRSVGEFGGEVDNWEWPRHTGDFSFFRAYVSPDGKPRGYDAANVPFQPQHYLGVSMQGVHENDLVLIMGYPGSTERYLTSTAVADRQGVFYPLRHELFANTIRLIDAGCNGNEAKTLAWSSTVKSLANVEKNALGMIKGLERNATVQIKQEEEERFSDWVKADAARQEKYGDLLPALKALDAGAAQNSIRDLMFVTLMSPGTVPFFRMLVDMVRAMARTDADGQYPGGLVRTVRGTGSTRDLHEIQLPILAFLIDEVKAQPAKVQLEGVAKFPSGEGTLAALRDAVKRSKLDTPEGRIAFLRQGRGALDGNKDPLITMAMGMANEWQRYAQRHDAEDGARMLLGRRWIEAQQEWRGTSFYPDANSTLRVAIANVKGYQPRDGVWYPPHTTVAGILEKDTGTDPFDVPAALKAAAKGRKSSRFYDARIGDVPVCFLADGDTTGGNSGSPVINGSGELVGLNFDRAFESVSGDYGWNPDRSRNISVDVRFILWFLEQVIPAEHVLAEMRDATAKLAAARKR